MKKPAETKKLLKGVTQEFVDGIQAMTTDQLKAQIVILQVQNQENELFKETPKMVELEEQFQQAKDAYAQVFGPFKEASVSIKNKTKLVVERLKEKGGA